MDSTKSSATKRQCFIEEDDGLASIVDMDVGFSGSHHHYYPLVSRPLYYTSSSSMLRKSSFRNFSSSGYVSSPRSGNMRFFEDTHQPHFLDACFLCKKPLGDNQDIFMYRGDTPFCSEECRQEQIEIDESKEKSWNLSASMRALRKKDQRKSTSSNKTSQDCRIRTSTVAAA